MNKVKALIKNAIPVLAAEFHAAVKNGAGGAETTFSMESLKPNRKVEMWVTSAGLLICHHNGEYFATPMTNVIRIAFSSEEAEEMAA